MKPNFPFAVIDLIILLVYPIAFIAHHLQRLRGEKHRRKNTWIGPIDFAEKEHFHFG